MELFNGYDIDNLVTCQTYTTRTVFGTCQTLTIKPNSGVLTSGMLVVIYTAVSNANGELKISAEYDKSKKAAIPVVTATFQRTHA